MPNLDVLERGEVLDKIGLHLRTARIQRGLTQRELGARCGVTQTELSNVEQGKRLPSLPLFFRLAQVLELPLERFLSGELRPKIDRQTVLVHLYRLGIADLLVPRSCVLSAFPPTEETLAWALSGNAPDPRIVEAIPVVLAWNPVNARLLEGYGLAHDPRAASRLAWLADVALTLRTTGGIAGEFTAPLALEELIRRVPPSPTPDDLGRPALRETLPPVSRRWNIRYAATLETFQERAAHLLTLRTARPPEGGVVGREVS